MGSRLLYWIVIKPLSLLPHFLLYGFSDFFFLVLFYIIPYRKKVVRDNIRKSFPDKDEQWVNKTTKAFYRHFCDLVMESLKNFSISTDQATKRMMTLNPEIVNRYFEKGQSVLICGGHMGNWELWAVAAPQRLKGKVVAIYKKLSSDYFDHLMRETRAKFGLRLIPTSEVGDYLKTKDNTATALVFGFDQSPGNPVKSVWIRFLGRETAAFFGPEKYAKQLNQPIIYGRVDKIKRGYYTVNYELLTENPADMGYGEITQRLNKMLEKDIHHHPEIWLWSHKRWKHKRPDSVSMLEPLV